MTPTVDLCNPPVNLHDHTVNLGDPPVDLGDAPVDLSDPSQWTWVTPTVDLGDALMVRYARMHSVFFPTISLPTVVKNESKLQARHSCTPNIC